MVRTINAWKVSMREVVSPSLSPSPSPPLSLYPPSSVLSPPPLSKTHKPSQSLAFSTPSQKNVIKWAKLISFGIFKAVEVVQSQSEYRAFKKWNISNNELLVATIRIMKPKIHYLDAKFPSWITDFLIFSYRTAFDHSNTRLVHYSDPDCICCFMYCCWC